MKKWSIISVTLILVSILLLLLVNGLLSSYSMKIQKAHQSGYGVTLSYLPNFTSNTDYLHYYPMIDNVAQMNSNTDALPFGLNKISIKIRQLGNSLEDQSKRFIDIVKYANSKKVFVWISCVLPEDRDLEWHMYQLARKSHLKNVGLTLATYHSDVLERIHRVLAMRGHIRLVKGYYYGDLSKNWKQVTRFYKEALNLLVASGYYHAIATHDFTIIGPLLKENKEKWQHMEFSFFYTARKFVRNQMKKWNIDAGKIPMKSLYIPYGQILPYLKHNLADLDLKNIIKRKLKSIKYM